MDKELAMRSSTYSFLQEHPDLRKSTEQPVGNQSTISEIKRGAERNLCLKCLPSVSALGRNVTGDKETAQRLAWERRETAVS